MRKVPDRRHDDRRIEQGAHAATWIDSVFHWNFPNFRLQRSKKVTGAHREMFLDRAEREGRKEGQAADDQNHPDQKADEKPAIGREGSSRGRHDLLARKRSRYREHRYDEEKTPDPHGEAKCRIPERRVGAEAREGAAIVAGGRNIGIKRFAEAMRAGIGEARENP